MGLVVFRASATHCRTWPKAVLLPPSPDLTPVINHTINIALPHPKKNKPLLNHCLVQKLKSLAFVPMGWTTTMIPSWFTVAAH